MSSRSAIRDSDLPPLVYLIGYRATGKSTVARVMAEQLGWEWVDADQQIQQLAGNSIADIFREQGETVFRDLETQVVMDLSRKQHAVVSLGGGAVVREQNRKQVQTTGFAIWLRASLETIMARLAADPVTRSQRPNLTSVGGHDEVRQLLEARNPIYDECSHAVIDTDGKTIAEVVHDALGCLPNNHEIH